MLVNTTAITLRRQGQILGIPLSFHAVMGDLIWVRGANGTGKSTLLLTLAGLLPSTDLTWPDPKPSCFYLGHQLGLVPEFTAYEHCYYHPSLLRPRHERVMAVLEEVGLGVMVHRRCVQLSRGQQQRVAMAVGILSGATLWLLDEPLTGLDDTSVERMKGLIKRHTLQGAAIVVSHQDLSDLCTQTLNLREGVYGVA